MGDARLTLRQAASRSCDILVVDAFSGDAIPVHLLTRQAMSIYLDKLDRKGILAFHISNMYLDLLPICSALAADAGCVGLYRNDLEVTPAEVAEAMQRELHELMAAESTYHSETNKYSSDVVAAGYHPVPAVRVTTIDVNDRAWAARATTPILPGKSCVVYLGQPKKAPKTSADHAHPDSAREVACDKP